MDTTNETLELSAVNAWNQVVGGNKTSEGIQCVKYAEEWAKLMQIKLRELKETNLIKIRASVSLIANEADVYGLNGSMGRYSEMMLIACWKHGKELGIVCGYPMDRILELRAEAEAK